MVPNFPRIRLNGYALIKIFFSVSLMFIVPYFNAFAQDSNGAPKTSETSNESATSIPQGWSALVEEALASGKSDEALKLIDDVVKAAPKQSSVYVVRGMVHFRLGKIAESLVDFDKSIELNPASKASCWQRGISLYYLEKYAEGRDQFVIHREVNPQDVENSFWHFMCVAKLEGIDAARKQLLPSGYDSRPPLMDVLELLKGNRTTEEIITTTESVRGGPLGKAIARFYGYLYVALYFDCIGKNDLAVNYLEKCIEQKTGGYMADVARIHLEILKRRQAK